MVSGCKISKVKIVLNFKIKITRTLVIYVLCEAKNIDHYLGCRFSGLKLKIQSLFDFSIYLIKIRLDLQAKNSKVIGAWRK